MKFPPNLQSITFGTFFNQNIDKVKFPKSLEFIEFYKYSNQMLNDEIKEIKIHYIDEPIKNLPLCLKRIKFLKIDDGLKKREENIEKSKIPFGCEIMYE